LNKWLEFSKIRREKREKDLIDKARREEEAKKKSEEMEKRMREEYALQKARKLKKKGGDEKKAAKLKEGVYFMLPKA